jgi:hypothetical protein
MCAPKRSNRFVSSFVISAVVFVDRDVMAVRPDAIAPDFSRGGSFRPRAYRGLPRPAWPTEARETAMLEKILQRDGFSAPTSSTSFSWQCS